MPDRNKPAAPGELDTLRLFALGRVPRCGRCPRYRAMLAVGARATAIPGPPAYCSYQICAPLAARLGRPATAEPRSVNDRTGSPELGPRDILRPRSYAG
jgi:hypothetical protein